MSTTPTATPNSTQISWLKTHERIVLVFLVLLAEVWGFNRYTDAASAKAEARATVAEQALASQKAQDAQNAASVTQLTLQYQQLVSTLSAQNASLETALQARSEQVATQKAVDAQLPLSELASRLQTMGQAPAGSVSVSGSDIDLSQAGAVAVTQTLETIPALQADLTDTTATLQTTQKTLADANAVVNAQTTEITGLKITVTDSDTACKAQVAAVKAEGKKRSMSWFKRGFGLGFISGLFVGHAVP